MFKKFHSSLVLILGAPLIGSSYLTSKVSYAGDADIKLSVKGVSVGIEDLQLRGTLRVILSPLVPSSPLVGGVSVFFLNRPDIDFDLTNLLNILDIPGLR
ncbi:Extended synaptotagmin-3 [Exaiptasia diaphana]|nr:Extended synaptotagmin-3 [Exaiptasia diaphana]